MAAEVPTGRLGKPDNPEDYLAIQIGEFARRYGALYIPWDMWNHLRPGSDRFLFYMQDHGRVWIEFETQIRWLKP